MNEKTPLEKVEDFVVEKLDCMSRLDDVIGAEYKTGVKLALLAVYKAIQKFKQEEIEAMEKWYGKR